MKRLLVGLGWFVLIWLGTSFLMGMVVGAGARGFDEGYQRGQEFGSKYGWVPFLIAVVGASIGTVTGFLPGTKDRSHTSTGEQVSPVARTVKSSADGAELFCHQCGSPVRTDSRFCAKCGSKLFTSSDPPLPATPPAAQSTTSSPPTNAPAVAPLPEPVPTAPTTEQARGEQSSGSKLGAIAGLLITVGFFLPWVRACTGIELSGYDLAADSKHLGIQDSWVYWATLLAGLVCMSLFFLKRTDHKAARLEAAWTRLVVGVIGALPIISLWYKVQKEGEGLLELLGGGWITLGGYLGIVVSFFMDIAESPGTNTPTPPTNNSTDEVHPQGGGTSD